MEALGLATGSGSEYGYVFLITLFSLTRLCEVAENEIMDSKTVPAIKPILFIVILGCYVCNSKYNKL